MTSLLILATPCIALMATIINPAIGVLVALALAVALSILMTILFLQTWNVEDGDEVEDEAEAEAVVEDASNIVYAAFAALARSPGATSTSFRVANGIVVHQHPAADDREDANGYANGIWSEEVGLGDKNNSGRTEGSCRFGRSRFILGASILLLRTLAPERDMGRSKDSVDSGYQVGVGRVQTWFLKWCEDWTGRV